MTTRIRRTVTAAGLALSLLAFSAVPSQAFFFDRDGGNGPGPRLNLAEKVGVIFTEVLIGLGVWDQSGSVQDPDG